jgi:hypothetical protein
MSDLQTAPKGGFLFLTRMAVLMAVLKNILYFCGKSHWTSLQPAPDSREAFVIALAHPADQICERVRASTILVGLGAEPGSRYFALRRASWYAQKRNDD